MWNNYFGESAGYRPGNEEVALIKIDRDLKLAEAMGEGPRLLGWLAHSQTRAEAIANGIRSLETLASGQALGPVGTRAYAVMAVTRDRAPIENYLQRFTFSAIGPNSPSWWDIKMNSADFRFHLRQPAFLRLLRLGKCGGVRFCLRASLSIDRLASQRDRPSHAL